MVVVGISREVREIVTIIFISIIILCLFNLDLI